MGCTRLDAAVAPQGQWADADSGISVHPWHSEASPAPLKLVQTGFVEGVLPSDWQVQLLPETRYPQQGFMASPRIADWERRAGMIRGLEVFWIDVGKARIPSDFYYMVARGPAFRSMAARKACRPRAQEIVVDRPPDLTGRNYSAGDFVSVATGVCRGRQHTTRWTYVVAAPGFGPVRDVGIPTSGLYVVFAVVAGPQSRVLLEEILEGARFGQTSISQIVAEARTTR
jgi:hypothetical protein